MTLQDIRVLQTLQLHETPSNTTVEEIFFNFLQTLQVHYSDIPIHHFPHTKALTDKWVQQKTCTTERKYN